ncbi:LysR family transcriptional regulator [Streptomyces sp. LX-29]|uniref:LysR family transcriptional regulator n=1 Tax=Streptomyces sp. LX-29 TaxID=2900152 RepID=UPI00240D8DEC|nr:LysR family transcriptional regulator [Streptomyces sp. LX-29]WFB10492.1 LysR family transcriptional regulator [Streptomyces sp. LX-29]
MDARRILIFREIARTGSIAGAARELGWTQPAVSQHLRMLERQAGVALVVRQARGVRLTEAGRVLMRHAEALAARLRAADEDINALADLRAGVVRVAAFPSASATVVPRSLTVLARRHPHLDVRLREAEPPEALTMVSCGEVDLAVIFAYEEVADAEGDIVLSRLRTDPLRIVLPAAHHLAGAQSVALEQLAMERWIAGCPRCTEYLTRICQVSGFTPDIRHETDDYVVTQALVAGGLGIALLPQLALDAFHDHRVVTVDLPRPIQRHLYLAHHREAQRTPAVAAVAQTLRNAWANRTGEPGAHVAGEDGQS